MAGNIKGITIEIDGNVTPLQKALNSANKAVRDTQKELKEVTRLLKLDPTNIELLKQKQDLLNKAVTEAQKKLDTEKAALEALEKADPSIEGVKEKMERLKVQILEDTDAFNKAEQAAKDFGDAAKQHTKAVNEEFKEVGKKIEDVGGKVSKIGQDLTTHVTGPIVALGGASLAAFNEVDAAYDTIIQKTGATGEAAQEMYDIVDQIATSIPTDFQTAGDAVGEVNTRFGVTGDELEQLSETYIKFADLNGMEVTPAIDATQKALEAFGLGAEDAESYLDALNKASQDSGIGIDTLTSLTINNATALQEMGLSLEDSTALMAQLEKSGVPVETVMGGLSKALKKATDEGKPLDQALSDLQKTIGDSEDDTEGLAAAYELFGKQGDKVFKAIQDGTLDFENLGEIATESVGSVADTFEETQDPIDQWQTTLNELKLAGAELGATIGEVLQPILKDLAQIISDLKAKWDELSPGTQDAIVKAAGIVAVVGPIVAIIGSIISGIGGLITSLGVIGAALGVAASTVGIVIAILAALGVAIGYCIAHWDELKEKVANVWNAIVGYVTKLKEDVSAKWEELKSNLAQKIEAIKSDMQSKWNQIKSDTVDKVVGMKNDVVNKLIELKNKAVEKLNDIKSKFTEKFEAIKDKVKGVVDSIKGFFENLKLKIPKPELPELPSFSLETSTKTVFGKEITYPSGISVNWNAKAMANPYLFTSPTLFGAGEAGHEMMYGHDNLMRDITNATAVNNDALVDGMYRAFSAALQSADLKVQIGNREFGRILREAGAL